MKKIVKGLLFISVLISCTLNDISVNAEEYQEQAADIEEEIFDITSDHVILYNLEDKSILYEKNSNEKVQIASLTKIMTALVAIEHIENLEEVVTITSDVFRGLS